MQGTGPLLVEGSGPLLVEGSGPLLSNSSQPLLVEGVGPLQVVPEVLERRYAGDKLALQLAPLLSVQFTAMQNNAMQCNYDPIQLNNDNK